MSVFLRDLRRPTIAATLEVLGTAICTLTRSGHTLFNAAEPLAMTRAVERPENQRITTMSDRLLESRQGGHQQQPNPQEEELNHEPKLFAAPLHAVVDDHSTIRTGHQIRGIPD